MIVLFIERDLGTERGEVLAEKIRRYRAFFGRRSEVNATVAFVVESEWRARTVLAMARRDRIVPANLTIVVALATEVAADPMTARWLDGQLTYATADLPGASMASDWPILEPRCLVEPEALACLDERGLESVERWMLGDGDEPASQ